MPSPHSLSNPFQVTNIPLEEAYAHFLILQLLQLLPRECTCWLPGFGVQCGWHSQIQQHCNKTTTTKEKKKKNQFLISYLFRAQHRENRQKGLLRSLSLKKSLPLLEGLASNQPASRYLLWSPFVGHCQVLVHPPVLRAIKNKEAAWTITKFWETTKNQVRAEW